MIKAKFEFPIYDTRLPADVQRDKIVEEMIELAEEIKSEKTSPDRLFHEAQDILQTVIAYAVAQHDNHSEKKRVIQEVSEACNRDHNEKIERYINERGWH